MNSNQIHEYVRQRAIEQLVQDYGIENAIAGLADYCHTQAIRTTGTTREYWYELAEALCHIQDGWDTCCNR